jgi:hypothetical protein
MKLTRRKLGALIAGLLVCPLAKAEPEKSTGQRLEEALNEQGWLGNEGEWVHAQLGPHEVVTLVSDGKNWHIV